MYSHERKAGGVSAKIDEEEDAQNLLKTKKKEKPAKETKEE